MIANTMNRRVPASAVIFDWRVGKKTSIGVPDYCGGVVGVGCGCPESWGLGGGVVGVGVGF
jgi:hypothetical protein